MAGFNFDSLRRPDGLKRPTNPIEIFRSAPSLTGSPNDLWQGQSKALEAWHKARDKKDVLISLHTGAGKSLVGLLAAQSLVNEGTSRVLYVCATNDLVHQTSTEINLKLGFDHTTRVGGDFSNDLYSTGQGFCLTNYQALFNSRTTFRKDNRPEAIIFDDAHVAEKIIRDCFTLRISREKNSNSFTRIASLSRPYFHSMQRLDFFDNIVSGDSVHRIVLVPPHVTIALCREHALAVMLKEHGLYAGDTGYALQHLADHLATCTMLIQKTQLKSRRPFFRPSVLNF